MTTLYIENQTLVLARLDLEDLVASSVVCEMRASKASTKILTLVFPSGFNLCTSLVIAWLSIHSCASFVSRVCCFRRVTSLGFEMTSVPESRGLIVLRSGRVDIVDSHCGANIVDTCGVTRATLEWRLGGESSLSL